LVITGGPGVGKTTLINSILKILLAKSVAIAGAGKRVGQGRGCLIAVTVTGRGKAAR
jgi:nucleoside-triphosphatase THEP1